MFDRFRNYFRPIQELRSNDLATRLGSGWGGVGMITFIELGHTVDATPLGLGWGGVGMITFTELGHTVDATWATTYARAVKTSNGISWLINGFCRSTLESFDSGNICTRNGSELSSPCWTWCWGATCIVRLSRCTWWSPGWILQCCHRSCRKRYQGRESFVFRKSRCHLEHCDICPRDLCCIPIVIALAPLRKACIAGTTAIGLRVIFCRATLQNTHLQVCFIDDRFDIVQECCQRVGSKFFESSCALNAKDWHTPWATGNFQKRWQGLGGPSLFFEGQ